MTNIKSSNILTYNAAQELLAQKYYAIDPHCHSSFSYDVPDVIETSPETIINHLKSKKLIPIITDHDNINAYNYLKKKHIKILPAVELTFKPKIARKLILSKPIQTIHINVYGLTNHDLIILKEIAIRGDLDELVTYFKQNDLDYVYNHPFYHEKKEFLNWKVIPDLAKNYFNVLELNGSHSKGLNDIVQRLALKLNKGMISSSDNHTGTPGYGITIAEGKNFKDFWDNVKNNKAYIVRKNMGTLDIVREASRVFNQAFHAHKRQRKGRRYTPATEVEEIDTIIKSFTSGKYKNSIIIKKTMYMLLQSINYTAGPVLAWRLHVTKNETIAEKIRGRINLLTNKIKLLKNIRKKNSQNKIEHHRKNNHT